MLQVAKVLKSNGTEGGILIGLCEIAIDELDQKEPVYIEFDGLPVPFFFEELTPKGNTRALARLTGIRSLKDAEEIVGKAVYADYFEEDANGEDFSGWTLLDKGNKVGTIQGLEPIPGNPCLIVKTSNDEILVPLAEELILNINEKKRELNLDLPDGLL